MITDTADADVIRGRQSWDYFYVALAFALTLEGETIQMIAPLIFPWNVIAYAALGTLTFWLFLFNGWFQNKLIGLKSRYEERAR